jgi:hypothetical protein
VIGKSPGPWLELSLVAGGLMIVMIAVMWVQRPGAACTLSFEMPRVLALSRETDREHLAAEIASADRVARRYMRSSADPVEQRILFTDCDAALVRQIATRHGLSPDRVRAGFPDTP